MKTNFVSVSYNEDRFAYHIEWATKCRWKMFRKQEYEDMLRDILTEICKKWGMKILEMCIVDDHVHMVIVIPPTIRVSDALRYLRGSSAHELFQRQPKFRLRYPRGAFWSGCKFVRTVGVDNDATKNYVKNQKEHHASITCNLNSFEIHPASAG